MISDAVYTFGKTFTQNEEFLSEFRTKPIGCDNYYEAQEENPYGLTILNNINEVIAVILEFGKNI